MMSESEFREKLAKMETLLKDVERHVGTIFTGGNRAAAILPGGLGDGVHDLLVKLRDLVSKFFEETAKLLLNPGWPFGLLDAAGSWTDTVGGPISELSAKVSPDQLRIDNYWTGPAADAYASVLPAQQKALEAIKTATDSIDTQLTTLAIGIFALWGAVILAVVQYVAQLAAEAAAAATVVGAPEGAAAAGVSTAATISLVAAATTAFIAYVGVVVTTMRSINQTLQAGAGFPDGNWPKATTSDFSDGSLSDGDTTDWRIKTHD
ncbi:hypothetical protein [Actinoplanes sp. N902-109]|uniref:hypothetical protein n=1 Tax=Actinoplanes sp. (strain N902-109) TaxID=649831 RepID=UPI0012FCDB1C|nr:hypothetical protein [Actinoplanes sp. N902-109]